MPQEGRILSELAFKCTPFSKDFSARLGTLTLRRPDGSDITLDTPGMICWTSRGVVPHLSRDHVLASDMIKWVHVPFETFLERNPPVPILQEGENALHKFLGLQKGRHILSMSLRDPFDGRELPPNGSKFINAHCIRGVRKVTAEQYRSFVLSCNPDIVTALSDIPFTPPPFSQKRITKSLERSIAWLSSLLQPLPGPHPSLSPEKTHPLNIFVHMCGDTSEAARQAFSDSLLETLYGKESEMVKPYKRLDDAVTGYTFDLVPLRSSVLAPATDEEVVDSLAQHSERTPNRRTLDNRPFTRPNTDFVLPEFVKLLRSSLNPLPIRKPRIVTGASSPHEALRLIKDVGVDLFDVAWAQKAADWGVALDFTFPVQCLERPEVVDENVKSPRLREDGKRDLGHNLYSSDYAMDFTRLATSLVDSASASGHENTCPCIACSPSSPTDQITHSSVDVPYRPTEPIVYDPPFSRAYLHHLLHTHEMSAHALLAAHNLAVAEAFFKSVRKLLLECASVKVGVEQATCDVDPIRFTQEVNRFFEVYDSQLQVFEEAKRDWIAVDYARGKGRLAREKAKLGEADLTTKVEKMAELDKRSTEM